MPLSSFVAGGAREVSPSSLLRAVGNAILILFLVQGGIGILISLKYIPDPHSAYKFVAEHRSAGLFAFLLSFHYYASAGLIVLAGIFNVLLLWNARWSWQDRWLWWGGLGILGTALFFQITGNLLPGSAHDVRTAFIEASIAGGIPGVGQKIFTMLLGSTEVSGETFQRWYFLHRMGGTALFLLTGTMLFYGLRREKASRLSAVLPVLILVCLMGVAWSMEVPLGNAPSEADFANSTARPMWYVLPMHALLRGLSAINPEAGWVGAVLLPGVVLLGLLALPLVFRKGLPVEIGRLGTAVMGVGLVWLVLAYGDQVQSPFKEEVFSQATPVPEAKTEAIDEGRVKRGEQVFREAGCLRCHSVGSMGSAVVGPDLAGVGKRYVSREWFIQKMRDPQSVTPGSRMPSFAHLSEEKLEAIADYLRSLKND
jgi:mono/diheme cytochrome c family protein